MIVFADTSALGSAYLGDEADGSWIADTIFEGQDPVVVCELVDVELASLLARAQRDGRIDAAGVSERLDAYADHTADDGPIGVVPLAKDTLAQARAFVLQTPVRTLDAIHLAAARLLADATADTVVLLTRDVRQASAATSLGFRLHEAPSD
ncbi:MAG: type II toxin-antitoxin system VapC family toxin [Actinomycetota bacterium]|nr:type II toxin-antitoxin system VapC family toxin [Actinomycetota bacterium]